MTRKKYLLLVALAIISGLVGGVLSNWLLTTSTAIAQQPDRLRWVNSPAFRPYVPTKMEWLKVELLLAVADRLKGDEFRLDMVNPEHNPETIIIRVRYLPIASLEEVNKVVDSAKEAIRRFAETHEWQDWVRIREDVRMVNALNQVQTRREK